MTAPLWPTLTADQQATLIYTDSPTVDVGVELLNFDLTLAVDITAYLDTGTGDVEWDGTALVHRDCALTVSLPLAWGIAQVMIYRVLTDNVTGLQTRVNRGVFCLTSPESDVGSTVYSVDGTQRQVYTVTGQDRTILLDRQPGFSVYVPIGTTVLAALTSIYEQAGLPGYLIDGTAATLTLPKDMIWPMVPLAGDDTSSTDVQVFAPEADTDSEDDQATWRQMINDIHSLINYRAVYADENGLLRSAPYADPASRPITLTLDVTDPILSVVGVQRAVTKDLWSVPNRWVFVWSNMPDDGNGNPVTPTEGNSGVYIVDNVTDGPSSQVARNGLVYAQTYNLTAASGVQLIEQGEAQVAADKRQVTTYAIKLFPTLVFLGHFDVIAMTDPALGDDPVRVQITKWTESFTNDDVDVTAELIG